MMSSYRGEAPQDEEDDETAMARRKHAAREAEQDSMNSARGLGASGGIKLSARSKELKKAGHVAVATVHKHDGQSHDGEATPAPVPEPEPAAEP